jgi:hypothetical protein
MYCMYCLTPVNVLFDLPVDLPLNVKNVEEDSVPGQKSSQGQRGQTLRKIWLDVRSS